MTIVAYHPERLLILANTYPVPSTKYRETNCVAAVTESGELRRIFPIPYRLLDGDGKFKKWEWITANVMKATGDNRPESFRIDIDSIRRHAQIPTKDEWRQRTEWIQSHIVDSFPALEERRQQSGETLGVIGPVELFGLDIVPQETADWTDAELAKLQQDGLFDSGEARNRRTLRKVPYRFYYRYSLAGKEHKHLITDWEAGTLYWRCVRDYGSMWERYFREKLLEEFGKKKDLLFLMGTMHRFPKNWLIVSLIYPPKGALSRPRQVSLFDSF